MGRYFVDVRKMKHKVSFQPLFEYILECLIFFIV